MKYNLNDDYAMRTINNNLIIFPKKTGVNDIIYKFSDISKVMLELILKYNDLEGVVSQIISMYNTNRTTVKRDLTKFIEQLIAANILEGKCNETN